MDLRRQDRDAQWILECDAVWGTGVNRSGATLLKLHECARAARKGGKKEKKEEEEEEKVEMEGAGGGGIKNKSK